jgi:hypothetical protein
MLRDEQMKPGAWFEWVVLGLMFATFAVWARMKKSAEEVGSWGPKKPSAP